MYQGSMERLLNHSESCQVRKVASLLAEPLRELEARGIVYEITGRQRGKVYAGMPVLDAIFGISQ